jgi:hypothetical protein
VLEHRKRNRILTAGWVVTLVLAMFGPLGSRVFPAPFDPRNVLAICFAMTFLISFLIRGRGNHLGLAMMMSISATCLGAGIGFAIDIGLASPLTQKCLAVGAACLALFLHRLIFVEPEPIADTRGFDVRTLPNNTAERYEITSLEDLNGK